MDPYMVLGVGRQASQKEIQRAWRRQALKFHPDRNPSAEAKSRFQELQEAYELLSDPVRKRQYDTFGSAARINRPVYTNSPPPAPVAVEDDGEVEMIRRSSVFVRVFGILFTAVCLLVLVDFLFPPEILYDEVVGMERQGNSIKIFTASGNSFSVEPVRAGYFRTEPNLTVNRSRFLQILKEIHTIPGNHSMGVPGSFYGTFMFMPVLWMILAIAGMLSRNIPKPRFYLMVVQLFFMVIGMALLLTSRWN